MNVIPLLHKSDFRTSEYGTRVMNATNNRFPTDNRLGWAPIAALRAQQRHPDFSSRSQIPFVNGLSLEVPLPAFPRVPGRVSNPAPYPAVAKYNFANKSVPKWNLGTSLTSYERISCPEGAVSHSPRLRYAATLGACRRPDGVPQRGYVRAGRNPFRVVKGLGPCDPRVAAYRNPGLIDGIPLGFQRHFVPKCNLGTSLRVCHSRAGGNPVPTNVLSESIWIPACAGMTRRVGAGTSPSQVELGNGRSLEVPLPAFPCILGWVSNPAAYPVVAKSNFAGRCVPKWNLGTRAEGKGHSQVQLGNEGCGGRCVTALAGKNLGTRVTRLTCVMRCNTGPIRNPFLIGHRNNIMR